MPSPRGLDDNPLISSPPDAPPTRPPSSFPSTVPMPVQLEYAADLALPSSTDLSPAVFSTPPRTLPLLLPIPLLALIFCRLRSDRCRQQFLPSLPTLDFSPPSGLPRSVFQPLPTPPLDQLTPRQPLSLAVASPYQLKRHITITVHKNKTSFRRSASTTLPQ